MNSTRFWTSSLLSAALFGLFDRPLIAQQKQPAEPPVAVVPNLDLLSPAAARREAFVSQRGNRLQAHSVVLLDWINLSADLSEQQKQQLNATLSTATTQAQAAWTGEGAKSTNTDYLLPINFTVASGPVPKLHSAATKAVANDEAVSSEQAGKLSKAIAERENYYRQAALGYVVESTG